MVLNLSLVMSSVKAFKELHSKIFGLMVALGALDKDLTECQIVKDNLSRLWDMKKNPFCCIQHVIFDMSGATSVLVKFSFCCPLDPPALDFPFFLLKGS